MRDNDRKEPQYDGTYALLRQPYLSVYERRYHLSDGHSTSYYVTANTPPGLNLEDEELISRTSGVAVLAESEDGKRVLLNHEFRMAVNAYTYNLPMGLVGKDEDPVQAARRELVEETGLSIKRICAISPEMYINIGTTANRMQIIYCVAEGDLRASDREKEITRPFWATRKDLFRSLLPVHGRMFSSIGYAYAAMWASSPGTMELLWDSQY